MQIKPLCSDYAVSPQIAPTDISAIKDAGFRVVICNRPDPEIPPDLHAEVIQAAVEAAGLTFVKNCVVSGAMTYDNLDLQEEALKAADGPVLAYCASGNRSGIVWSLIQARAKAMSADEILAATRAVGYDHSGLRQQLETIAEE